MLGQVLTRAIRSQTLDDIVDAMGHAHVVHHLAQHSGGGRGLLGGLDHHRVAAGERRADLPRHQQKRQVPRADHPENAARLADRVVERAVTGGRILLERLGRESLQEFGEDREVGRAAGNIDMGGQVHRLAGIGNLGFEEFVEPGIDPVGDRAQHLRAGFDRELAPLAVQRIPGRDNRLVDQVPVRFMNLGFEPARRRVDVFEFALAARYIGAIDEVPHFLDVAQLPSPRQVMEFGADHRRGPIPGHALAIVGPLSGQPMSGRGRLARRIPHP